MSEHKVGTVAMVTYGGERCKAYKHGNDEDSRRGAWVVTQAGVNWSVDRRTKDLDDITPLVCIEATREDADELDQCFDLGHIRHLKSAHVRLRDAIREQTPEPEQPKRWTWAREDGVFWLVDSGRWTETQSSVLSEIQRIVDLLNAAEVKP